MDPRRGEDSLTSLLRVETPEAIELDFEIADVGLRFAAFLIDLLLWFVVLTPLFVVMLWLFDEDNPAATHLAALIFVFIFAGSSMYFAAAEVHGRGRTIGKRICRIRTIDRQGYPLEIAALFMRNLTRSLELFFPYFLSALGFVSLDSAVQSLVYWGFVLVWYAYPLVDRKHRRIGDFLAGTVVVKMPRPGMKADLLEKQLRRATTEEGEAPHFMNEFTAEELDLYGIHELQTLERLLRGKTLEADSARDIRRVILRKMRRPTNQHRGSARQFLEDLYAQLRPRLEQHMSLGDRRERKQVGRLGDETRLADARERHSGGK